MNTVIMDLKYPIFTQSYRCIVPYGKTFSEEHIATYGLRGTGNLDFDEDLFLKPHQVRWPIHKLADLYAEDYKVTITFREDCVRIYNAITTYLEQWKKVIDESSINMTVLPMDDLEKLDAFASAIYPEGRKLIHANIEPLDDLDVLKDDYRPLSVTKTDLPVVHTDEYISILRDHSSKVGVNL